MKKIALIAVSLVSLVRFSLPAEEFTLEWCQEKARDMYPLIRQSGLIEKSKEYTLSMANAGYLPRLTLSGTSSYQSEVTELPVSIPGIQIDSPSKDQYRIVAEINQTVWDGGVIGSQKKIAEASAAVEQKKLEVELYALRDRVNQIYLGILLLNGQIGQNTLLSEELDTNYQRIAAYLANGVANKTDLDAIVVEKLNAEQARTELISMRNSYRDMLSRMLGTEFTDSDSFAFPAPEIPATDVAGFMRPEISLYAAQEQLNDEQRNLVIAGNKPKIMAFLQVGYGKPGLNQLKTDFTDFYLTGVKVLWALDGFYSLQSSLDKIAVNEKMIEIQKETFLYNTDLKIAQQINEIRKLQNLIQTDGEVIAYRSKIKKAAEAKYKNGTQTVSDLIREITAENLAVQKKVLHEIQLLLSVYNLKFTLNK